MQELVFDAYQLLAVLHVLQRAFKCGAQSWMM